ncbi:two-component system NtrC family sensor kinase [Bradyrhizobium diazoefficiens]
MTTPSNDVAGIDELKRQLQSAAAENARLRDRESASAEILRTIAASPSDTRPVFAAIASSSKRLLGGFSATVLQFIGDELHLVAFTPTSHDADEGLKASFPRRIEDFPTFALVRGGETIQFPDSEAEHVPELNRNLARLRGFRSVLFMPLMNRGAAVGMISVTRAEPGAFAPDLVQLLQTFADQAVIAIENARLFNETKETLERQTATADILKVMAGSPSDVQPVFDAIAANANRLIGGFSTAVLRYLDGAAHLAAFTPTDPAGDLVLQSSFPVPFARFPPYPLVANGAAAQLPDTELEPAALDIARARGYRSMLFAPLMSEGEAIGVIIATRRETGVFGEHHVRLLQTFADQAVIAIENARLFNEVQQRTNELTEALEQQTATAEVLSVISSSGGDLVPVFDAMLAKAMQLCGANFGVLNTFDGKSFHSAATYGLPPAYDEYRRMQPLEYGPGTAPARLLLGEPYVEIDNLDDTAAYRSGDANRRALVDLGGARCLLTVPLIKDDRVVGNVMIFRQEQRRFTDKQIRLLQQFAAQAVIAIENTRLLRELRGSTEELTEALRHQTGSANILKVIASSPTDVGPALKAIVESACELCDAYDAAVALKDGDSLRFSAHHGPIPINLEKWPINRNWTAGRAFVDRLPVHVADLSESDEFPEGRAHALRMGHRSILSVPLLQENESIGAIVLRRNEVHPFTDQQVALLQTFADQAVIAIGNVRLFEQVQARTRELAKSLDDLRAAQDRLVQTEKLASLGQLTAGIAHEIKNPLNFVNNFAAVSAELMDELNRSLADTKLTDTTREEVDELSGMLKGNLQKIVQHGRRADSIVKNMLLHSREGGGEHRLSDINALVEESLNLAYHGARAEKPLFDVTLKSELDPAAGSAEVFPQEISRVLLNLISNGLYAVTKRQMGSGAAGYEPVVIATTRDRGDSIEIRIRDNGTGIADEVKEKMFNPFFTTKPAGEGTGLGLSMSHDIIVKQHGGTIDVTTEPGKFTEFTILLPRKSSFAENNKE